MRGMQDTENTGRGDGERKAIIAERLYRNVKAICQTKNLKIGEIEKEAGMSVGYLSRGKVVRIEMCESLADVLGVTLDNLLRRDYASEAEAEKARKRLAASVRNAKRYFGSRNVRSIVNDALDEDEWGAEFEIEKDEKEQGKKWTDTGASGHLRSR